VKHTAGEAVNEPDLFKLKTNPSSGPFGRALTNESYLKHVVSCNVILQLLARKVLILDNKTTKSLHSVSSIKI
jgi:hypothetical protein